MQEAAKNIQPHGKIVTTYYTEKISWFPNITYTLVPFVCAYVCVWGGVHVCACACVCIRKKFGRIHTEILPVTVSGCWSYK